MSNVVHNRTSGNSYSSNANFKRYSNYEPNFTIVDDGSYKAPIGGDILKELAMDQDSRRGLAGMFDKLVNKYKTRYQARRAPGGVLSGLNGTATNGAVSNPGNLPVPAGTPAGAGGNQTLLGMLKNNVGYNSKSGLSVMGKNVGKAVPYLAGGISAIQAAKGLSDLGEARDDTHDLVSQILASASGNPNAALDLTSEQNRLLRELRSGGYKEANADLGDVELLEVLKGAGVGALGGLAGGIPGVVVGALGGAINGGISSVNDAQVADQAQLEALLNSLEMSEMAYKNNLKQRAYAR